MKKLIVATMMLCASTAQAADWSPVFKGWFGNCLGGFRHPVAKAVYRASSAEVKLVSDGYPEVYHTVLSHEGRVGDYSAVPMPYRQDLLPAVHLDRHYHHDGSQRFYGEPAGVYIPLKNAKFYNLPLQSIAFDYWEVAWYYELNFGKYSKAKELQLKKAIKRSEGGATWMARTEHDELIWVCEMT